MPPCAGDASVPAFRLNFVKVSPDALMNGECGISATYGAVGDIAGPDLRGEAQIASPAIIVTKALTHDPRAHPALADRLYLLDDYRSGVVLSFEHSLRVRQSSLTNQLT